MAASTTGLQGTQLATGRSAEIAAHPPVKGYSALNSCVAEQSLLEQVKNVSRAAGVVFFGNGCNPLFSFLNNDHLSPLEFDGLRYPCVLSAYEAQKFLGRIEMRERFTNLNAEQAYAFSAEKHLMKDGGWYKRRWESMGHVLRAKFGQNPDLKEMLVETGAAYLSCHTPHKKMDPFWTNDSDGSGANNLGLLLMDIRWENGGCGRVALPEKYQESALRQNPTPTLLPCLEKSDEEILSEIRELNDCMDTQKYELNSQIARRPDNLEFTRFRVNNFPYDKTLVPLSSGRFINASFLLDKQFIGTQSPMPHTMGDFWLMIFEHKVPVVIMLNRLGDPGDDIYFPFSLEDRKQYGDIHLSLREPPLFTTDPSWRQSPYEEEPHAIIHRKIVIQYKDEKRLVHHFQYQNWRDFSAGNERAAAHLVKAVNAIRKENSGPTAIHCHAGVGRTAALIALLSEEENLESGTVDLRRNVERQRSPEEGRTNGMMQAEEQYAFCYLTLREIAQA